jgi:hypothetical protein
MMFNESKKAVEILWTKRRRGGNMLCQWCTRRYTLTHTVTDVAVALYWAQCTSWNFTPRLGSVWCVVPSSFILKACVFNKKTSSYWALVCTFTAMGNTVALALLAAAQTPLLDVLPAETWYTDVLHYNGRLGIVLAALGSSWKRKTTATSRQNICITMVYFPFSRRLPVSS